MSLQDPVAVYNAGTNVEAHLVARMLDEAGVAAAAVEDASVVGLWAFGLLPQIHKPQVWVERADLARAVALLKQYERDLIAKQRVATDGEPIAVTCEDCGEVSHFPAQHKGSVQECSHCHAYVDVDDELPFDDWRNARE